jgi:hypothetical protein
MPVIPLSIDSVYNVTFTAYDSLIHYFHQEHIISGQLVGKCMCVRGTNVVSVSMILGMSI